MPARKPIGAVISPPTVTTSSQSSAGSQPASARIPTTSPNPSPKKSAVIHGARSHPGATSRRQPVGGGAETGCPASSATAVIESSLPRPSGSSAGLRARPPCELVLAQDRDRRPHERVADTAELGADDGVLSGLRR